MPDLLILGTLHTLDPQRPRAAAALVRDGRFRVVGSREECERAAAPDAQVLAVRGCAVPGLADAHGHPLLYGRGLAEVRLGGAASEQECAARVARFAALHPGPGWVLGSGWDQNDWPGAAFPDAATLDAVVPDRPVVLNRIDVHASWANGAALRAAGIDRNTPDPPGGRIGRRADGAPSGLLIDTAMDLVRAAQPRRPADELEATLLRALRALAAVGLTCVHDASCGPETLEAYRRLAERDALPLRVYAMIDGQQPLARLDEQLALWRATPQVGRLTVRAVKLFADGALGSRGAALFEPYEDDPGNRGLFVMEPRDLAERIARVAAQGFQPCVHCIGDRATVSVLEACAGVPRALRPRAEHLQLLRARDVPLLVRSGALASMQPTHATSDAPWAEARLGHGTERQRGAYAWRQVLDAGVPLAFGSDFPVEEPDPRLGLRAAVARADRAGRVWMPEQRLTLPEALAAFTRGAAFAEFAEERRGQIREGFDADLTVFDRDLLELPVDELPRAPIAATLVGGRLAKVAS